MTSVASEGLGVMGEDVAAWGEDTGREEGQASETTDVTQAGGSVQRIGTEKPPHRWGRAGQGPGAGSGARCHAEESGSRQSSSGSGGQECVGGPGESCLVAGWGLCPARSGRRGRGGGRALVHSGERDGAQMHFEDQCLVGSASP